MTALAVREAAPGSVSVGTVTDLIWSPRLERNICYVWLPIELASPGTPLLIDGGAGTLAVGTTVNLPFLDPNKAIPKS